MKQIVQLVILVIVNKLAYSQSFDQCKIYEYSNGDSINKKLVFSNKYSNGKISYSHHFLPPKEHIDFIDYGHSEHEEFYYYADTLLSRCYFIAGRDSITTEYLYDSNNRISKILDYCHNHDSLSKLCNERVLEYKCNNIYRICDYSPSYMDNIDCRYKVYNSDHKIILDSNVRYYKSENYWGTHFHNEADQVDSIAFPGTGKDLYHSHNLENDVYNYFKNGYEIEKYMNGNSGMEVAFVDSFYFDLKNLLSIHVEYLRGSLMRKEVYHYSNTDRVERVNIEVIDDEEQKYSTYLYEWH